MSAWRVRLLVHPLTVASLLLLAFNDHVFKQRWPGVVTGKLSDVAGVWLVGALLIAALGSVRWGAALTALGFAALKTSLWVAAGWDGLELHMVGGAAGPVAAVLDQPTRSVDASVACAAARVRGALRRPARTCACSVRVLHSTASRPTESTNALQRATMVRAVTPSLASSESTARSNWTTSGSSESASTATSAPRDVRWSVGLAGSGWS